MTDVSLWIAVHDLYARYATLLDAGRYPEWLALFARQCSYVVQPRENADRGLPLCTMRLESRGMIEDRIHGISNTLYHDPYYQRHLISGLLIEDGPVIRVTGNYLVIRTFAAQPSDLFNAGRFEDELVREEGELKFQARHCIFDTELVPNSMIYPV